MDTLDMAKPTGPREDPAARVAAYFRSVGLHDERRLAAATRAFLARTGSEHRPANPQDLRQHTVEAAIDEVARWLDELAAQAHGLPETDVRGQLAWRLRPVLGRHPEAFLKRADWPKSFAQAVQEAAAPVVPPPNGAPMNVHQFEELAMESLPRALRRLWQKVTAATHHRPSTMRKG